MVNNTHKNKTKKQNKKTKQKQTAFADFLILEQYHK